jgi:ankyrin repeat protein
MQEDEFESTEEKNFVEAYKNCMTPLQLSCILGQDEIAIYLIERAQANPNLQTNIKGYACLHLAVLANKPEMVIELLTRTNSNPNLPDYSGRTLLEMVEKYIPYYLDNFTSSIYYNLVMNFDCYSD